MLAPAPLCPVCKEPIADDDPTVAPLVETPMPPLSEIRGRAGRRRKPPSESPVDVAAGG